MANKIEEEGRPTYDPNDFKSQVAEYKKLKDNIAFFETRVKELRDKLIAELDANGVEDEDGNIVLRFPEAVEGVVALVKTRRVSRKLDETRAMEIIEEHGLTDELVVMVPTIAEDAVMASLYEGKLNENEVDQMFPATVTWALNTKK
jgi:hypothetical protein